MARANLKGLGEVNFLRKTVRAAYESHANRTLVANTNKGNYISLAEEISTKANKKALGSRLEKMDLTVSEGQVRSLFMESNKDFLDYFVQACYFYAHGMAREDFLALPENADLIKSWETEYLPVFIAQIGFEETLQNENSILNQHIQYLKRRIKRLVFGLILGVAATFGVIFFQKNTHTVAFDRLKIWSGSSGNISKEDLVPHLDFLQPQAKFLNIVDTIVQSLLTPSVFHTSEAALPVINYKNIIATSGYKKFGNSFFPDQISIIPFHGFAEMRLDTAIAKTRGMASVLHKLYSREAHQNDETHVKTNILAKIMHLDKTQFDVDLIYVGYKQDISNADSDDFMLRYPPYKLDESDLQNYVMVTRQWWKEAINKTGIHWQQDFNGQKRICGISKPYPTVRTNAPNQRTFWVEIAPDSLNNKTRMVLAIDLILKEF